MMSIIVVGSFMLGFGTSIINNIVLKIKNDTNRKKGKKVVKRHNKVLNYKGGILSVASGIICGAFGGYHISSAAISGYMLGVREYSFLGNLTSILIGGGNFQEVHLEKMNKNTYLGIVCVVIVVIDVFYLIVLTGHSISNMTIDTISFVKKVCNYLFKRIKD